MIDQLRRENMLSPSAGFAEAVTDASASLESKSSSSLLGLSKFSTASSKKIGPTTSQIQTAKSPKAKVDKL